VHPFPLSFSMRNPSLQNHSCNFFESVTIVRSNKKLDQLLCLWTLCSMLLLSIVSPHINIRSHLPNWRCVEHMMPMNGLTSYKAENKQVTSCCAAWTNTEVFLPQTNLILPIVVTQAIKVNSRQTVRETCITCYLFQNRSF
jgi:hypothetical protein